MSSLMVLSRLDSLPTPPPPPRDRARETSILAPTNEESHCEKSVVGRGGIEDGDMWSVGEGRGALEEEEEELEDGVDGFLAEVEEEEEEEEEG